MILSISQQQLEDIIKAMKACAIFEEHKKEEILKPLREQLQNQIVEESKQHWQEEDVYDGFAEHTEAMQQARLREKQDKAAGRWSADKQGHWSPDDTVEHTKEYYDTQRNRPMTVSEQMQEELEPLPINTFK